MQGGMIFFTKKEGKSRAGLRMSKKCCNFAPDFGLAARYPLNHVVQNT